jgi:hypothetical protein
MEHDMIKVENPVFLEERPKENYSSLLEAWLAALKSD